MRLWDVVPGRCSFVLAEALKLEKLQTRQKDLRRKFAYEYNGAEEQREIYEQELRLERSRYIVPLFFCFLFTRDKTLFLYLFIVDTNCSTRLHGSALILQVVIEMCYVIYMVSNPSFVNNNSPMSKRRHVVRFLLSI